MVNQDEVQEPRRQLQVLLDSQEAESELQAEPHNTQTSYHGCVSPIFELHRAVDDQSK